MHDFSPRKFSRQQCSRQLSNGKVVLTLFNSFLSDDIAFEHELSEAEALEIHDPPTQQTEPLPAPCASSPRLGGVVVIMYMCKCTPRVSKQSSICEFPNEMFVVWYVVQPADQLHATSVEK